MARNKNLVRIHEAPHNPITHRISRSDPRPARVLSLYARLAPAPPTAARSDARADERHVGATRIVLVLSRSLSLGSWLDFLPACALL
jgi:hypothetical protein